MTKYNSESATPIPTPQYNGGYDSCIKPYSLRGYALFASPQVMFLTENKSNK